MIPRMSRAIRFLPVLLAPVALLAAQQRAGQTPAPPSAVTIAQETHLKNVKQLTNGGENAEAYFSFDGQRLSFQSTRGSHGCDQIYTMKIDGSDLHLISGDKGRTTCSFYYPDGKHLLYASTHLGGTPCPPPPSMAQGYVWAVYDTYDIFRTDPDGSNPVRLTSTPGYDAEATIAKDGRVVFTSVRDGDMEIYSMNGDGSDVRRLTNLPGPDGGAFFSPDGSQIVFRGYHPPAGTELDDFNRLLKLALWRPTSLEIFVMNRDGSNLRQVTHFGKANWAPYWTPDGKRIIFASNYLNPRSGEFDLFAIDIDGSHLERITYAGGFDGFPMFSPDGKRLAFCSNRHNAKAGETNVFVTDWVR
jgi:TolB protein